MESGKTCVCLKKPMHLLPYLFLYLLSFLPACTGLTHDDSYEGNLPGDDSLSIRSILPPDGYRRIGLPPGSFGEWLRNIPLRNDKRVFLYDGSLKRNQSAQYAVLDVPVGKKDLQQCADAVMRLRAQYFFDRNDFDSICFYDNNRQSYRWTHGSDSLRFQSYLERVFSFCGTASLARQLKACTDFRDIMPGDVLIRGGYPGHAMLVADMAINAEGEKMYLLAQSYMPAQDIHIVKNPLDRKGGPWYRADDSELIFTPEWTFRSSELRRW